MFVPPIVYSKSEEFVNIITVIIYVRIRLHVIIDDNSALPSAYFVRVRTHVIERMNIHTISTVLVHICCQQTAKLQNSAIYRSVWLHTNVSYTLMYRTAACTYVRTDSRTWIFPSAHADSKHTNTHPHTQHTQTRCLNSFIIMARRDGCVSVCELRTCAYVGAR